MKLEAKVDLNHDIIHGIDLKLRDLPKIHKTLSKSFGMQRKTLMRVLALEKKVAELEAIKEATKEASKELSKEEVVEELEQELGDEIPAELDGVLDDIRGEGVKSTPGDWDEEVDGDWDALKKKKTPTKKKPLAKKKKKPPFKAKKKKISTADLKKGTSQDIPETVPEWFLKLEEQQREKEERIERLEQNAKDVAAAEKHQQTDQFKETESGLDPETGEQLSGEERKRRFKLRKKNISTDKFFGREEKSVEADTTGASDLAVIKKDKVDPGKMIPHAESEESAAKGGDIVEIRQGVESIVDTLQAQYKEQIDAAKDAKKDAEQAKRDKAEKGLEGAQWDGIKKAGQKVIKPFKSVWDKILGFLSTILFGRIAFKLWEWFADPNNQAKVQSIIKFFKDWWPTLLTAYLLFGNAFGRFAVKMTVAVTRFTVNLLKKMIPKLLAALAKLKASKMLKGGLIAGGILAAGVIGSKIFGGGGDEGVDQDPVQSADEGSPNLEPAGDTGGDTPGVAAEGGGLIERYKEIEKYNEGGLVQKYKEVLQKYNEGGLVQKYNDGVFIQKYNGGGLVEYITTTSKGSSFRFPSLSGGSRGGRGGSSSSGGSSVKGYKEGGFVSGPGGVDQVPARLTAGEFVMSKGAVDKFGTDTLESMNAAGGGTNVPTPITVDSPQDTPGHKGGGIVNPRYSMRGGVANQQFKGGGVVNQNFVTGFAANGGGTIPARLTSGEYVMNRSAVSNFGVNTFYKMNAAGGGTNNPVNNKYFVGGLVKGAMDIGGKLVNKAKEGLQNIKERIAEKDKTTEYDIAPGKKTTVKIVYEGKSKPQPSNAQGENSGSNIPEFSAITMRSGPKIRVLGVSV